MRFDFGFGFGFGGHCEQYLHKSWCIIPSNCFFGREGVGRFDFGAISRQSPANHFLVWMTGGWVRFDFRFGFGFGGHCEQFSDKGRCIMAATFFV